MVATRKGRVLVVLLLGLARCTCDDKRPTTEHPLLMVVDEAPAAVRADLGSIQEAGVVRLIVRRLQLETRPGEWGEGPPAFRKARALAGALGVGVQLILVPDPPTAHDALAQGKGDAIMPDPGVAAPKDGSVEVSMPERHADAVVVVGRDKKAPQSLTEMDGWRLGVAPGTDVVDLLADVDAKEIAGVHTILVEDARDTEDLLLRVGTGGLDATVAYRDDVDAYLAHEQDVRVAFTLRANVPARWIVRAGATELLEAINGLVYGKAMTAHKQETYAGTLPEIRRRGVLRVGMLNNAASYFTYKGMEVGFQYELAKLLATRLDVRLEAVVPSRPSAMLALLADGRADIITVTEIGAGMATTVPLSFADYLLVQNSEAPRIESPRQLRGKTVHVRQTSSYVDRLLQLEDEVGLAVAFASEDLETEELIDQVGKGEIELTVANSVLLAVEQTFRDDVQGTLVLEKNRPLLYAVRADAPRLVSAVNAIIERERRGPGLERIRAKYFANRSRMTRLLGEQSSESGRLSPFDELARTYARRYGLDWRLVLAQMYQESRFDPEAKSWVGATGLMQIMPATGRQLGVVDLTDPETNIYAGTKYMAQLIAQFEPRLPMRQRVRFALASYNAGYGHVQDARRLAQRQGLDPDRWFGNVERAIVLLEKRRYYKRARHGYCRGSEPAAYVSRIQTKYDAYVAIMPAQGPIEE